MFDILDEIIFEDTLGNTLTQSRAPGQPANYKYCVYDKVGNLKDSWVETTDLGAIPLKVFKQTEAYKKFCTVTADNSAAPKKEEPAQPRKLYGQSSLAKAAAGTKTFADLRNKYPNYSFVGNSYWNDYSDKGSSRYIYTPPAAKTGYLDKCNKSDTLVFHLNDPSTVMLKQLYEGKGFDVITDSNVDKDEIHQLMQSHSRIMCLGHGTAGGLIGGNIGPSEAPYFKGKQIFIIWCNADQYFKRYCPEAKGQFITKNAPSEVWECRAAGCGNISAGLMLENITYWSKLCADKVEDILAGHGAEAVEYIRKNYLEKYGNHPVTLFNADSVSLLGVDTPLPDYEFKGTPLAPKDYPVAHFDEVAFLQQPTASAAQCPVTAEAAKTQTQNASTNNKKYYAWAKGGNQLRWFDNYADEEV